MKTNLPKLLDLLIFYIHLVPAERAFPEFWNSALRENCVSWTVLGIQKNQAGGIPRFANFRYAGTRCMFTKF